MNDCVHCGRTATGLAYIDGKRYCHGDEDRSPTCYEQNVTIDSHAVTVVPVWDLVNDEPGTA